MLQSLHLLLALFAEEELQHLVAYVKGAEDLLQLEETVVIQVELQQLSQVGHELTHHGYFVHQFLAQLGLLYFLVTDYLTVATLHMEEGVFGEEGFIGVIASASLGAEDSLVHGLVGSHVVVELDLIVRVDDELLVTSLQSMHLEVDEVVDDLDDLAAHLAGVFSCLQVLQHPVELRQVALSHQPFELVQLVLE